MNLTRTYWPEWKKNLQIRGFLDETAEILEILAPFGFIFSQFHYLLGWLFPTGQTSNFVHNISTLLEDGSEIRHFVRYLKESEHDLS
jgi:hypothetical protein